MYEAEEGGSVVARGSCSVLKSGSLLLLLLVNLEDSKDAYPAVGYLPLVTRPIYPTRHNRKLKWVVMTYSPPAGGRESARGA